MSRTKPEIQSINQRQKEFYEVKRKNLPTRIWYFFRNGLLHDVRKTIGVDKAVYAQHLKWFGDLSNKKVLDLGCYEGNSLSYHLASHSREYIGIDLSEKGINFLNKRLRDLPQARGIVCDFLSESFKEKDFDLIYAYGVLHHFKDTDGLIEKLDEKLAPKGEIISNDPLQTNLPIKLIRSLYRPFQSDKDWEWPFSKKTFYKYDNAFTIKERRAVLGKSKWFFILNLLPISRDRRLAIGNQWHKEDWDLSCHSDYKMFQCMHLTMLMQKRD